MTQKILFSRLSGFIITAIIQHVVVVANVVFVVVVVVVVVDGIGVVVSNKSG